MKIFTIGAGALVIGAALIAAVPADAQYRGYRTGYGGPYGGYRGGYSGRGRAYAGYGLRGGYDGYGGYYPGAYGYRGYAAYPGYYGYRGYGGYPYYGHGYYDGVALAIGAGLLGVMLGTVIAARPRERYYEYYETQAPPPPEMQTCPDAVVPSTQYCPQLQQQPPVNWTPERG